VYGRRGLAIGLALSGTLQNFAGGVIILILKPFKLGDFIDAQGYTGTVKIFHLLNISHNGSSSLRTHLLIILLKLCEESIGNLE
jgi:small-conductance mechanosensitive channel